MVEGQEHVLRVERFGHRSLNLVRTSAVVSDKGRDPIFLEVRFAQD
jgi:hypothetical protein